MLLEKENRSTLRKICSSATWSEINPTWSSLRSGPGLRGENLATNRLSHYKASPACCGKRTHVRT